VLKRLIGVPLAALCMMGLALPATAVTRIDEPHQVQDLAYGESLFSYFQNRHFDSISYLKLRQSQQRFVNDPVKADILLASMYVSYGLYDDAEKIFNALLTQSVSAQTRNAVWLQLATIYYHRGNLNKALELLSKPQEQPTPEQNNAYHLLIALIQLELQQTEQAIAHLKQIDPDAQQSVTAEFNLGVAYAGTGQHDRAQQYFRAAFAEPFDDEIGAGIKERSALAMGVSLLKTQKWKQARDAFKQVRLHSQYSNQALLGLGWSYFGEKQDAQALGAWMELLKRDPIDRAVQEAYLQIAYVFEEHGALQTAFESYQRALVTYKNSHERVNATRAFVSKANWLEQLSEANEATDPFAPTIEFGVPQEALPKHLYPFYASNVFQAAWRSYQENYRLKKTLAYWRTQTPIYLDIVQANQQKLNLVSANSSQKLNDYQLRLNSQKQRASQLSAKLQEAVQSNNILATATDNQLAFSAKLDALQRKISTLPKTASYDEERARYARLKGVFMWDLHNTALQRRWEAQKADKAIHEGLDEAARRLESAGTAKQRAAQQFGGFQQRVSGLHQRMDGIDKRIDALLRLQEQHLKTIVLAELDRYEQHLTQLTAQTNLAIARMHDSAFMQQYRPDALQEKPVDGQTEEVPQSLIEAVRRLMRDDPLKDQPK